MRYPKILALATLLACTGFPLQAADYTIDLVHSQVGFRIRHLVSKTRGQFKDYQGQFSYDPARPESSKLEAVIQTKSIDTNNEKRDTHLRSADFFNVEKFPLMSYKSISVKRVAPDKLQVAGELTLLGVTKPVTLDVEEGGVVKDPRGAIRAGFSATTRINRKDFGMNWNKVLDAGSLMIGDEVEIFLDIEAVQKP